MNCLWIFDISVAVTLVVNFLGMDNAALEKNTDVCISFSAALNRSFRILPQLCVLFIYMALLAQCIVHISFAAFFSDAYFTEVWHMNVLCSAKYIAHVC
jgi:hypothetical protein